MDARLALFSRPGGRRLLLCAAAMVALVSVTSACGGGGDAQAAANDPPLLKYSSSMLSFSYPSAWTASAPKGPGELHFHPLVYLSTQQVGEPCSVDGNETTCDWPIRQLSPGGVLALWEIPYAPGAFGYKPRGTRITVGHRPGWRTETNGGACSRIGADRTIQVYVDSSPEFTACLRGPDLAQAEKSVDALLASTKFPSQ